MNRIWLVPSLMACTLASGLWSGRASVAADEAAGARLLPKNTLIYVSAPSVPAMRESMAKSPFGALLRDPEMQPFLADVQAKIDELSEQLEDKIGVTIDDLLAIPQGEVTFALMERPARKLAPVLIVDYGNRDTVDKLLKKMHESLEEERAEHSTEEIEDVTVHVFKFADVEPGNPLQSMAYFDDDSCLVFSTEVAALTSVLQRWDGESTDTLADNEIYQFILDKCTEESSDPELVWFVSPIGLIQSGLSMAQAAVPQAGMAGLFLPTLGLDRLKGWGGAISSDTDDFQEVTRSFIYAEQPKGVLEVFQFPASELAPPAWVPASTGSYFSANWNLAQAYQAIETMIDGIYGRGFTAKQLDMAAEDGPEVHPKRDLIDQVEGRFHLLQGVEVSEDEEPIQQFLLAIHVKDAAQVRKTLAKAVEAGGTAEQREFNGETIYEVEAGPGQLLSAAIAAGCIVVTNEVSWLEGMLRSETQPSLVDSPDYQKIAQHFPSKVSMLSYTSAEAQIKPAYEMLRQAESLEFIEGIDLTKLPSFESISKYLSATGSYIIPDSKGALYVEFQLKTE